MNKLKKQLSSLFLAGILISVPPLFPSTVKDPVTLSNWLKKDFTFQEEPVGKDHWKYPKEMLKDKGGDCEDFALLARYVLKELGYKTYLIGVFYKDQDIGHAITIIRHRDRTFSYFSNQDYISIKFKSVRDLLDHESESYKPYLDFEWESAYLMFSKYVKIRYWGNK